MASTNKTTHYNLSQYIANDKPTYLVDYNNDMEAIDGGIYNAQSSADSASAEAQNAQSSADNAQQTANTAVTNAGQAQSKADSVDTKVGDLANLDTTTKTNIVSAINELKNDVDDLPSQIIESGVNELGRYIKFGDGTMITTQKVSESGISVNNAWGGIYSSTELNLPNFPQEFIAIPNVTIENLSTAGGNYFLMHSGNVTTLNGGKISFLRGTAGQVGGEISVIAIGRYRV